MDTSTDGPTVARIKFTMEDYSKWKRSEVARWITDESESMEYPILRHELEKNLYAFNEYSGAELQAMGPEDFLVLGVSPRSRDALWVSLRAIRQVDLDLSPRRRRAESVLAALITSDGEGQGYLSLQDAEAALKLALPNLSAPIVTIGAKALVRHTDHRGSGVVVLRELTGDDHNTTLMQVLTEVAKAEEAEINFRSLDRNRNGFLEPEEIRTLVSKTFPTLGLTNQRKQVSALVKECDKSGDGRITFTELFSAESLGGLLGVDYLEREDAMMRSSGTIIPQASLAGSRSVTPAASPSPLPSVRSVSPMALSRPGSAASSRPGSALSSRCPATSPKLIARQSTSGGSTYRSPRSRSPVSVVERLDQNDLKPSGLTGEELIEHAESLLDEKTHGTNPWQEALEYFEDAGEIFKREGEYLEAGRAFQRCSDCKEKLFRYVEAAESARSASYCFREVGDGALALECLQQAAELFNSQNRERSAARTHYEMAELYEAMGDYESSLDTCVRVIPVLKKPEDAMLKYTAMVKAAQLYSRIDLFDDCYKACVHVFDFIRKHNQEEGVCACLHPQLAAYVIFIGVLSIMAAVEGREVGQRQAAIRRADEALRRFRVLDRVSKEYHLLNSVLASIRQESLIGFEEAVDMWAFKSSGGGSDDVWMTHLLNSIRSHLEDSVQY